MEQRWSGEGQVLLEYVCNKANTSVNFSLDPPPDNYQHHNGKDTVKAQIL